MADPQELLNDVVSEEIDDATFLQMFDADTPVKTDYQKKLDDLGIRIITTPSELEQRREEVTEQEYQNLLEATAEGKIETEMSVPTLATIAASTVGGMAAPAALGLKYGGTLKKDIATIGVAALGAGLSEQVAKETFRSFGYLEPIPAMERLYDFGGNLAIDAALETAVMAGGRFAGPIRTLIQKQTGWLQTMNRDYALTRAFVDNPRQFSDWLGTAIGSDSIGLTEAFQKFKRQVLQAKNAPNWNFTASNRLFSTIQVMHKEALEGAGQTLENVMKAVREKTEKDFDRVAKGPSIIKTDAAAADLTEAGVPATRGEEPLGLPMSALPEAEVPGMLPAGGEGAVPSVIPDVPATATPNVPRRYKYQVDRPAGMELETIPEAGAKAQRIEVDVEDLERPASGVSSTLYDKAEELPLTFDFEFSEFGLEELYEAINSRGASLVDSPVEGLQNLGKLVDSERGVTALGRNIRKEIDGIYRKHDPETYRRLVAAQKLEQTTSNRLAKQREQMAAGAWDNLSDKQLANRLGQLETDANTLRNLRTNIEDYKTRLGEIIISGEEAQRIRQSWDALSKPQARAAGANLESLMGYEAFLTMANKFRTVIGSRIAEIDPELGKKWANTNELYAIYKRVEPHVNLRAMPEEVSNNYGRALRFLEISPVQSLEIALERPASAGQFTKPIVEVTRGLSRAIEQPLTLGARLPGAAAGLSDLPRVLGGPDPEAWAEAVGQYGWETVKSLMGVEEAQAQQQQMLTEVRDWKNTRNKYIADLLNGSGNSREYALQKATQTRGGAPIGPELKITVTPEDGETPTVEMEDTGLGTKKRKEQ